MAASNWAGRGTPLGGIWPARTLRRMISHPSRLSVSDPARVKAMIFNPPDITWSLWHGEQVEAKTGATVFSKVASADKPTDVSARVRTRTRKHSISLLQLYSETAFWFWPYLCKSTES